MGYMLDSHGFSQCNRVELSAGQCSVNLRPLAPEIRVCNDLQLAAHVDRCEDTTYGALLPRRCDNHCRCTDFCLSGLHDCRGGLGVIFHEDFASFCTTWPPARCVASCYLVLARWKFHQFHPSHASQCMTLSFMTSGQQWQMLLSQLTPSVHQHHVRVCASSSVQVGQLHTLQTTRTDMVRHKSMNPEVAG